MIRSHLILLVIFLLTPIAQADPWREGTALITCYPGAGYFELSSKAILSGRHCARARRAGCSRYAFAKRAQGKAVLM